MKLRWKELILAFTIAVGAWFIMSGTETIESQVDARVEYRGIPQNLAIRGDGLVRKVTVRLRGPAGQVRAMVLREHVFVMNLATVHKGVNMLPFNVSQLGFFGDLQIIDVIPPVIRIDVDSLETKEVPLHAKVVGNIPEGYTAQVRFSPASVTLRGSAQELANIESLDIPVAIGDNPFPSSFEVNDVLTLPSGIGATPSHARALVELDFKRTLVHIARSVFADSPPAGHGVFIRPAKVKITAAIPEGIAAKAAQDSEIKAFIVLPQHELGTYALPVRVTLPDGAKLVKVEPGEVSVTVEQKNPDARRH